MPGRGTRREHQVRAELERDGWVVVRAAGSLGAVDLVALRAGDRPRFVQVKSDRVTPWKNFGPTERDRLLQVAEQAGADACLLWWPPRGPAVLINSPAWPTHSAAWHRRRPDN